MAQICSAALAAELEKQVPGAAKRAGMTVANLRSAIEGVLASTIAKSPPTVQREAECVIQRAVEMWRELMAEEAAERISRRL